MERMLNKEVIPTESDMLAFTGETKYLLLELKKYLISNNYLDYEIRFPYGKNYGWSFTFRKNKKLICDIFPLKDAFEVMLRLSNKQYSLVYDEVSSYTKNYIDNKYPCGDGGWIHYIVNDQSSLTDIIKLLSQKLAK